MEFKEMLVRPLVTEKTVSHLGGEDTYAFEVGLGANKFQIKKAVQEFYNVKVKAVRTMVVRGKTKRFGRFVGKRSNWKKAYITLEAGHSLPIYES